MIFSCLLFISALVADTFDWQSHRGARGLMPENSIESIQEALKYPISTIEIDVVISQDRQVVVSHEPWMEEEICLDLQNRPIYGKKINLYQLSYEQIAQYDCGTKNHPRFPLQKKIKVHKPLLKDVLSKFSSEKKNWSIEIKSTLEHEKTGYQPDYQTFTHLVVKTIMEFLTPDQFYIQSFDQRVLKFIHQEYPQIRLVALRETQYKKENVIKELGFKPFIFSPHYKLLTLSDIEYFKRQKIKVIPWTINQVEEMKSFIEMGVDGIITDYPNRIEDASKK